MSREQLQAENFNYDLPDERIAIYPLDNRNNSKLLTYKGGIVNKDVFPNLKNHLPKNSLLIFNDTRVIAARMFFFNNTGAKLEVFCLEPFESTIEQTLTSKRTCVWKCIVGNLKRWRKNDVLEMEIAGVTLKASVVDRRYRHVILRFDWDGGMDFSTILQAAGQIPLPPYLNRELEKEDNQNYQTVYAKKSGAVAAPTAGLHFIDKQLIDLQKEGHDLAYLTLFVGSGTFRPVTAEKLVDHTMHQERIVIEKNTLKKLASKGKKVICVGTTSLRSLESMYWLAVKIKHTGNLNENVLTQEDAYELPNNLSWSSACEFLLTVLEKTGKLTVDFYSALFIMPGYEFKSIDGLITNFHQPQSTLLALVSAFIGDDWKKVYDFALQNDFRFLSYGDSSILLRE